jgi:hypothetical protein
MLFHHYSLGDVLPSQTYVEIERKLTVFHNDVLSRCFQRLHHLQSLYRNGKILWGSPEHFEILALEEMESRYVREEMRRLYQAQQRLEERVSGSPRPERT